MERDVKELLKSASERDGTAKEREVHKRQQQQQSVPQCDDDTNSRMHLSQH